MRFLSLLMGAAAPAGEGADGAAQSGPPIQILIIVGLFAVFYLFIIRPQRKKQKDEQKMREAVKKGDKVVSIGGIRGTVKNVNEKTIIVEVDNKGATLEFTKNAIGTVETAAAAPESSGKSES